jgi:4-carboxymuconolactone decarboxylase
MAWLPYPDAKAPSPRVREVLDQIPPLNIFRMMANADSAFVPWLRWGAALLTELELPADLREIAILRVARLTPGAEYEWIQHEAIARSVGVSEAQVAALARDKPEDACFKEREKIVLRFTSQVVTDARPSEQVLEQAKGELSARQVVELLMVIGQYMLVGRVMATTGIEMDEPIAQGVNG